ncbi:MAG TPA: hypothetical protein VF983_03630, partial [Streptosporangiaceae bacterium]
HAGGDRRKPLTCLIAGKSDIEQAPGPVFDHGAQGYSAPSHHPGSMITVCAARVIIRNPPDPPR